MNKGNTFSTWNYDGIATFEDIVEATDGFDDKYRIGTGAYMKVYKANLPGGQIVAVKKLHPLEVYEYMERGSLASIQSNGEGAAQLDSTLRVNVIKGVTHALSYKHHDCNLPFVHRDLSSNNVLLNSELG
ncbi:MDIS1-interacting receptor like kinase 2-like [Magnolia sinica]|uniref:MDIS1-interacting receptor like kinase 2-like n=1 Tax=Magnolia sinica TaxID=86752 RepID=UPI00265A8221|nr:MDIS1-interacting receptor like kinase 2-like [Magnolia sinica]